MKTSIVQNIFFSLITLLLSACCKDQNPTLKGCQKTQNEYYVKHLYEAENYLWAKPGSYWIYKNTKTGDLDTQQVTNFAFFTDTTINFKGVKKSERLIYIIYDLLYVRIYSSFNKWYYVHTTNRYNNLGDEVNSNRVICEREVSGEGSVQPFFFPFEVGLQGAGDGTSYTTLKSLESKYTLQGKEFLKVAIFEIDLDVIWYPNSIKYPKTRYYWAENVGLVKRENTKENYSWELIEYNIIK
jgi:hypothetical protein